MELRLTPAQEQALERCLMTYDQPYNFLTNNCGDPLQDCLQSIGIDLGGHNLTPAGLGQTLQNSGLVNGVNFYPKVR
jgi:hypothetical protein